MELDSKIETPPVHSSYDAESGNKGSRGKRLDNTHDVAILARFGKRQQLRRGFGLLSVVGFTCTLMCTWEAVGITLLPGLENGGLAGLVYGYIFVWIGTILQALVFAEMASMIPLAGGPFNWLAVLSPPQYKEFLSYLGGWLTLIAWQALFAVNAECSGTLIQGLLVLNYPSYKYERWHATLLFDAVVFFTIFVNSYLGRHLPQVEAITLFFHIFGFFGILIPLVYFSPQQKSATKVFGTFADFGGWDNQGLSFFIGLLTAMKFFPGADAADHIAEEIYDAPHVIPHSMWISASFNGLLGFGMLLALLFCMGDVEATVNSASAFPFIQIYQDAVGSVGGATIMSAIIVAAQSFAAIGVHAAASRMIWAFARENGLPFSAQLSRVGSSSHLPINALLLSALLNCALAVINIGSVEAFNVLLSFLVASYFSAFLLPAIVMLHKRLTTPDSEIPWGPFRLGRAGVGVTVAAISYSIIGLFFSFWPNAKEVNAATMNYSVVIYAAALGICLLFWGLHGKRVYTGPILELM